MLDKKTVLIVEYNEDTLEMFTMLIEIAGGYHVRQATRGSEAFAYLETNKPDCIVLSAWGTEMTVIKFLHNLRSQPDWAQIPVLVHSGGSMEKQLREVGADMVMASPLDSQELFLRIQILLGDKEK